MRPSLYLFVMQSLRRRYILLEIDFGIGNGFLLCVNLCDFHKSLGSVVEWATSFGHLFHSCVGQINISLDPFRVLCSGHSNMQSRCAAIWRLYDYTFNREIFRPTEKSKLIFHLAP